MTIQSRKMIMKALRKQGNLAEELSVNEAECEEAAVIATLPAMGNE